MSTSLVLIVVLELSVIIHDLHRVIGHGTVEVNFLFSCLFIIKFE